jgi:hypothetical protein
MVTDRTISSVGSRHYPAAHCPKMAQTTSTPNSLFYFQLGVRKRETGLLYSQIHPFNIVVPITVLCSRSLPGSYNSAAF